MVLYDFVFHYASLRLFYRHLGQRDTLFIGCHSGFVKNLVNLLLGVCCKHLLRFAHSFHLCFKSFHIVDDLRHYCFFLCHFDKSSCTRILYNSRASQTPRPNRCSYWLLTTILSIGYR